MLPTLPLAKGQLAPGTTSLSHSQQETPAGALPAGRTPTATLAGTGRKLKKKKSSWQNESLFQTRYFFSSKDTKEFKHRA